MDSLVKCDECRHEFVLKKLKTKKLTNGVEKTFFSCPSCKKEYVSFITDKNLRNKQKEMQRLRLKIRKQSNKKLDDLDKIVSMQEDVKKMMADLKAKYI